MAKSVVLSKVENNSQFAGAWSGNVFYTSSNPKHGVLDELSLCKILKFKYTKSLQQLVGDFCLMPYLVK